MNCEDIGLRLNEPLDRPDSPGGRQVMHHVASCASCKDAMRALEWLRAEQDLRVPAPRPGAFRRAVRAAADVAGGGRRRGTEFWQGLAVGAAAAAGIAALSMMLVLRGNVPGAVAPAEVALALHEPHDVSIAIEAPAPMRDVEIRVTLRGAVDLRGFEGQRDVQWTTDLEQGINQLTLPVRATGAQGGQVQVVVSHGNKRKTFLVDVHAGRA